MSNKPNPFELYVEERLHIMAAEHDFEAREASKQAVTVRLPPSLVRLLDGLSEKLADSRQGLLLEIVATSLHQISRAYADSFGDKAEEVYQQLMDLKKHQEGDFK